MLNIVEGLRSPFQAKIEEHLSRGELQQASAAAEAELHRNPQNINAMLWLGQVYLSMRRYALGAVILSWACRLMKDLTKEGLLTGEHPEPWTALGLCFHKMHHSGEAQNAFEYAYELDPRHADNLNNLGSLHINTGEPEEAEKWFRRCLEVVPDHPNAHFNLSLALGEQGRMGECWKHQEVALAAMIRPNRQYDAPPWDGTEVDTLVVYGEQGIGDELLFASMVPDLDPLVRKRLILDCHPRLIGMFERSFRPIFGDRLALYPTRKEMHLTIPRWLPGEPGIDAKISMASLGGVFRNEHADFPGTPYLAADPELVESYLRAFKGMFGDRPVIGWTWWGGKPESHSYERALPPAQLLPLLCRDDVAWLCLQHTNGVPDPIGELGRLQAEAGIDLAYMIHEIDDFERLTAMTDACDLIITVDQTLVHQAGAVGTPCWVLTPKGCSWRYSMLEDPTRMLWWESVKLFRQEERGEWMPVVNRIGGALNAWMNERTMEAAE